MEPSEYPLPAHPLLREAAIALRDARHAGMIFDDGWRLVHTTEELRWSWRDSTDRGPAPVALGEHLFSSASLRIAESWRYGLNSTEMWADFFRAIGGLVLADTPGGRDGLRLLVDPALRDVVDELSPCEATTLSFPLIATSVGEPREGSIVVIRVRDPSGRLCGSVLISKPAVGMATLFGMAHDRDVPHLERMDSVSRAGRRPAAILFADIEGSSSLARRLPTSSYFALTRRLVRAADQCVVDAGGLVGRHVGDGVVAFFPAETSGSESAAARACLVAARTLRSAISEVAGQSDLTGDDLVLRFGLHWGATLYLGRITTLARTEVTAMGDEVNEAARVEACATGGLTLASKPLMERLDLDDASALGIDPDTLKYTQLGDLDTATDKARRDAPAIAVCEL